MKEKFVLLNNDKLFSVDSEKFKYFLGGLIEGEASLHVSIKKQENSKFGFALDPEFCIYQHVNGLPLLNAVQKMFKTGKVFKKFSSSYVYVFVIYNRKSIKEKVIPFFEKYVLPFSCKYIFFHEYCTVIDALIEGKHKDLKEFLILLEKVYTLNSFKDQERKYTFEEIRNIILRDYTPNK
jgi:hypothetical protein